MQSFSLKSSSELSHSERFARIMWVLWIIMFLNLAVAAGKYIYGVITGSLSMTSDGIASAFDALSNVVGIIGIRMASRPPDTEHPYGHGKFETYASVCIGVMLLFAAGNVLVGGVQAILNSDSKVRVDIISYVVMVGTLIVNIMVSLYEAGAGKRLKSEILSADALHTRSDALVSVSVIVGLVFVSMGFPIADAIASFIVGITIFISAIEVFKAANATLSDRSRIAEEDIEKVALSVANIESVHSVRTRGTEGEVFVDLHVLVDPLMSVSAAHDRAKKVEESIKSAYPDVIEVMIHIEPNTYAERKEGVEEAIQ